MREFVGLAALSTGRSSCCDVVGASLEAEIDMGQCKIPWWARPPFIYQDGRKENETNHVVVGHALRRQIMGTLFRPRERSMRH